MEPWLGHCYVIKSDKNTQEIYSVLAAAFCQTQKHFDDVLRAHLAEYGLQLLWSEDVSEATGWLARNDDAVASSLVQSLDGRSTARIGPLMGTTDHQTAIERTSFISIGEPKITPLPNQKDIPFWDRAWISPDLREALFGPETDDVPARTYFIMDATLRRNEIGLYDLDSIDVPVQCLFKGEAEANYKQSAPHLIDMTLSEAARHNPDEVPDFHKHFFATQWEKGTGIFVRSDQDFDAVTRHFRRLTKFTEEDERSYFFSFWESNAIFDYLDHIKTDPVKVTTFFKSRTATITNIISFGRFTKRIHSFTPDREFLDGGTQKATPFFLDDGDKKALLRSLLRITAIAAAAQAKDISPKQMQGKSEAECEALALATIEDMHRLGFRDKGLLQQLALQSLLNGPKFELAVNDLARQDNFTSMRDEMKKYDHIRDAILASE